MKKPKKYLEFYEQCMKTKRLPDEGLCGCLGTETVQNFAPDENEARQIENEFGFTGSLFWAHGEKYNIMEDRVVHDFTSLRQTVVLFLAAMNGEL